MSLNSSLNTVCIFSDIYTKSIKVMLKGRKFGVTISAVSLAPIHVWLS